MIRLVLSIAVILSWQSGTWARPLPEGFYLQGLEGVLVDPCESHLWTFEVESPWISEDYEIQVGAKWTLLPTHALHEITQVVAARDTHHWRLNGRVTSYRGQSFLYVERGRPQVMVDPNAQESPEPNELVEAASAIGIPKGLVESMAARPETPGHPGWPSMASGDRLLVDRIGSLVPQDGRWYFRLESLGRSEAGQLVEVMPSQTRERLEQIQAAGGQGERFRVVALQTEVQGQTYLFLLRAVRVYSRGNFGR